MSFNSWLQNLRSARAPGRGQRPQRRRGSLRAATHRLNLEALEDRCLLSFSPALSYPAGAFPHGVLTADFNADGKADLAVINVFSSSVSVLLGNANGTFRPALTSATGYLPLSLAVGDFNADGKLDLVTAGSSELSLLLGDGNGAFRDSPIGPGSNPTSVAVGDFNADGKLDLVVESTIYFPGDPGIPGYWVGADPYYGGGVYYPGTPGTPGTSESSASVLLGNGNGTFQPAQNFPTGSNWASPSSTRVVVADFNADRKLDIVIANAPIGTASNGTLSVLLGKGDGSFLPAQDGVAGGSPVSVAVGDFDGDGKADLATANVDSKSVSVLLGNGLGSFVAAQNYAVGAQPWAVAVADFNGDGKADLMTADIGAHAGDVSVVSVLLGNGDGTFQRVRDYAAAISPLSVALADFNGDSLPDVAVTNYYSSEVSVLVNDGNWPALGAPSISINDVTVTEGNTGTVNTTFTLGLSAAYGQPVTIHYKTADGSATAGSDYMATSGDVTFGIGQTIKTITIAALGDRLAEPTENFVVNLSAPINVTIADGQGIGIILDNEPRISINDVTVTEGNTGTVNATFTVSLSVAYDVPVTVHYQTANGTATAGSDYAAASGDVKIAAGQTTKTFTVAVIGDRSAEPTETLVVNLSAASNGLFVDSKGVGTILDNEPRISISDASKKEGRTSQTTLFTFTVTLSVAYDQAVTMSFRTSNGTATTSNSDYIAKSSTLTFASGETTKTITIEVKGDSQREAHETFYLDLFGNSSNSLFTKKRGIGTILNDD